VLIKHYYKALFDYEYMIRSFPGSEHYHLALEREFEVANIFASGTKRRWLGMRMLSASGEAEEIYIRTQERAPGSLIGEKASLSLGDFYFKRGEMNSAAEAYQLFLENYPRSRYRERVMLRRIEADLASFNSPVFDPTGLLNASIHIRQFEEEFPASAERLGTQALLVRVNDSLASKDLHTAQWYEKRRKDNVSAVYMYGRIVKDHPQTAAARTAEIALARLEPTLAGGAAK
jgi:outer membrane assembly lipoprotein YfiO